MPWGHTSFCIPALNSHRTTQIPQLSLTKCSNFYKWGSHSSRNRLHPPTDVKMVKNDLVPTESGTTAGATPGKRWHMPHLVHGIKQMFQCLLQGSVPRLRAGRSFSPVFVASLCFSRVPGLWPRKEEVPCSHRTASTPARDLSQEGESRGEGLTKRSKAIFY